MKENDEQVPAYVTKCPDCGALRSAVVNDGTDRASVGRFVAREIRHGRQIEPSTAGAVRAGPWCQCPSPTRKVRP
jgi:hypothetical protein